MAAISTKNGLVDIGGNSMLSPKWTVEISADEIDVTTFESGGFTDYITSYVDANVSIDCFYDLGENPFDPNAAPSILVGKVVYCKLWLVRTGGRNGLPIGNANAAPVNCNFHFPSLLITRLNSVVAVRDAVRYDFNGRNKGYFLYPGAVTYSGIETIGANNLNGANN